MEKRLGRSASLAAAALLCAVAIPLQAQVTVAGSTPGSFRVTEVGAAEYRIPLRVPPGIAGMEPKLSLAYNSQGGNGLLGIGWTLQGLSIIHRCSKTIVQDGFAGGIHYDGNDRYCLDGQRLVAVSGSYGADGTEYRTERESFTKVVSYGGSGSDPSYFRAWTKSGQVLDYGSSADSRIEAQGRSQARLWALNKVADTVGNYLAVSYAEDNGNGDFYPTRIDYTGNPSSNPAVQPFASVRLTYESRADVRQLYVGGALIKTMNRLVNAKTYLGESAVTDYRVAYEYSPNGGPSRAVSVTECSGDGTQCLPATTLSWQNPSGGGLVGASLVAQPAAVAADVDGDGLADIVYASGGTLYVRYSSGSSFQGPTAIGTLPVWSYTEGGEPIYAQWVAGDFDGNGRADVALQTGAAYLSTAGGFSSVSWPGFARGRVVDVNGDGLADVVHQVTTGSGLGSGSSLYVSYSTGGGFQGPAHILTLPVMSYNEFGDPTFASWISGDFDGDGRADIVLQTGTAYLSTAAGFTSVSWAGYVPAAMAVDLNGDGLTDLVYSASGTVYVRQSSGVGFDAPMAIGSLPVISYTEEGVPIYPGVIAADFDGNGRADVATDSTSGPSWLSTAPTPDLATTITSSLGAAITVVHKPLTDGSVHTKDNDAVWPVRDLHFQGPVYVVSSSATANGIGGARTTNYFYRGAKAHMKGGGFLGFRQVEATDAATGLASVSTARQDYPYHGLSAQGLRKQSSGATIGQTTNTWTTTSLTPASGSGGNYHKAELTQSSESGADLNGAALPTVTTATGYDGFGNAQTVSVTTGDGYSKTTTNTYAAADVTNWILGRLTGSSIASVTPTDSKTRASAFAYDPVTGLLTKEVVEPGDANFCLVTAYQYDSFGNKASATTRNCNGSPGEAAAPAGNAAFAARSSTESFAATAANPIAGRFAATSTNALSQTETKEFDARFGLPTKLTGPNGLVTTWVYDNFGRRTSESRADGTTSAWTYSACGTCPANGGYFVTVTSTARPTSSTYFDVLNREIRAETQGFNGTMVLKDTEYDALGRVSRASRPYYASGSPAWTTFDYDVLGRVRTRTEPNQATATTTYNGLTTTVTNALNQSEARVKNSQGQLISVTRQ